MSVIIFLIILAVLILAHEFGHFIVAKRAGIRVDEFGLGFPPRLWGFKKGETLYSINVIPFGGFVKIFGEDPNEEAMKGPDARRSFIHKPRPTQAVVIAAGIAFNVFFGWALFSASFMIGVPASVESAGGRTISNPQVIITALLKDAPAQKAGLREGDSVKSASVSGASLDPVTIENLQQFIAAHPTEEITLSYERGGKPMSAAMVPAEGVIAGKPGIGIAMDEVGLLRLPFFTAIIEGVKVTFIAIGATAVGFGVLVYEAIHGAADFSSVSGPVGIVGYVGAAAAIGFSNLLSFTALISINLAVINLIPFPALDGGRLFIILIESIKRRPLNPTFVNRVNTIGFAVLILLMVVVTYSDIVKLL